MRLIVRPFLAAILAACILMTGCAGVGNLFSGGTAKQNAVQALVTTTRSAVLLMTAAGIAYDFGAFGEPGSARAEDTWKKIATESIRLSEALTAWSEAIKANKDAAAWQSSVNQALAVIGALLPSRPTAELLPLMPASSPLMFDPVTSAGRLSDPNSFRAVPQFAGGSR